MPNDADGHEPDKLARWHRDLTDGKLNKFPVYCVFLVSPEDRMSHQVFRRFRDSFESRAAGFEHLVIFGQHGISATLRALLAEFGLSQEDVPVLALISPETGTVHTLSLAPGASDDGALQASGEGETELSPGNRR